MLCGALVHAFEPLPALHSKLMLAAPSNFTAHAMAVSDEDGFAEFRVNRFDAVSSLLPMDEAARSARIGGDLLHEEREILVPTTRLDTFMEWDRFSRISEVGPTGCVVAVEPSPRELARLRANLAANHLDNVTVVAAALAERAGDISLKIVQVEHAGKNTMGEFIYEGITCTETEVLPAVTVDELAAKMLWLTSM
jgi:FkbM family methyltransferase